MPLVRIGRFLIIGALTLSACAVAGLAYVRSIDFDRHRPALVAELRAATGREVVIDGPVGLSLWPRPRFFASEVAVANAPWGTRNALMRLDRVEADLAILPLLQGDWRLSKVRLIRPDLWFETDAVGKINWILAGDGTPVHALGNGRAQERGGDAEAGKILASLDIGRVELEGGRITYRDGATGDITVLSVRDASIEGDGYTRPLAFVFSGSWDAIPVVMRGVVGPFDAVASDAGTASSVNLRFESGSAKASIDGTVGDPFNGPGAELRVTAVADDLDLLGRRLGLALPLASQASFDATVRYRKARMEVTDATLKIGARDLTGTLSVDLSKSRPSFDGALQMAEIDARALAHSMLVSSSGDAGIGVIEALAGSGAFAAADGSVSLRAEKMHLADLSFSDLDATVVVKHGRVTVDPIRMRSIAGVLNGGIAIDSGVVPTKISAHFKAPAFSPGPLLQRTGTIKAFGGVASVAAALTADLGSPEAMLASLDGDVLLAMGEGRLTLEPVEAPFVENVRGLGVLAGLTMAETRQDVAIDCVAGRLTIEGVSARSDGFVLKSADARVKGDGHVDLETGEIAFRFMPEPRDAVLRVGRPVLVGGTLSAPVARLEEGAGKPAAISDTALYPFRRFFSGLSANPSANACLRALPPIPRKRRAKGRPIAQRPAGSPAQQSAVPSLVGESVNSPGGQAE